MNGATLPSSGAPIVSQRASGASPRAFVRRAVEAFRLRHPDLRDGVTVLSLLAACHRDEVHVQRRPLASNTYGMAIALPWDIMRDEIGPQSAYSRTIFLSPKLVGRSLVYVFAHEIGHHELGHCIDGVHLVLRGAARKRWQPETADDRRRRLQHEAEADDFARLLTGLERPAFGWLELAG